MDNNSNVDFGRFKHVNFQSDEKMSNDNKIVVMKLGSSSISRPDGKVSLSTIARLVEFIYELKQHGYKVVLVTSGAVSMGMGSLHYLTRPSDVLVKQSLAAIGQSKLMTLYDGLFQMFGLTTAQILLTRDNLSSDFHYLNASNTLMQLLSDDCEQVIPIINENDCVSQLEKKLGDNDQLSAYVASMINASHLFLLTDVDSLYTANPKTDPNATPIHFVDNIDMTSLLQQYTNIAETPIQSGQFGTGGIATKLIAAKIATSCGVMTSIVSSERFPDVLTILKKDYSVGTTFNCNNSGLFNGKKKFIFIGMTCCGTIYIKDTTVAQHKLQQVISSNGFDIKPSDVLYCEGNFGPNTCVNIRVATEEQIAEKFPPFPRTRPSTPTGESSASRETGTLLGRGLSNFCSNDIQKIRGLYDDEQCALILGLKNVPDDVVIHIVDAENCAVKL